MIDNFRRFQTVDPFGRSWTIEYRWQQTAISIRHSDTVDVKFELIGGEDVQEKVIALSHPDLLGLSKKYDRPLTDPWCMKLAALHIKKMVETDRDMEKTLVAVSLEELENYVQVLEQPAAAHR